jgi:hypothetical protein
MFDIVSAPSSSRAQTGTSSATTRCRVARHTISPATNWQIYHFGNVFFSLELSDIVVLPDVLDEGFHIAADCFTAAIS